MKEEKAAGLAVNSNKMTSDLEANIRKVVGSIIGVLTLFYHV